MQWSIQQLARASGTTSRTLRHYDDIGLLRPSRVGGNGHRYYDQDALIRLQRILLLRELGLGLSAIGEVLAGQRDTAAALRTHLELLETERERIERQIRSVRTTLTKTQRGEQMDADEAFDGFDHTQYEQEVVQRWGQEAYQRGDAWWRSLTAEQKKAVQQEQVQIAADYGRAFTAGEAPDGDLTQEIVRRHVRWLSRAMQSAATELSRDYLVGLGRLYVDDERYGANYDRHGQGTAGFVRAALEVYAERHLAG
jgi:MerR family transcriptional regulator, thiopeptide resistance regulator